MRLFQWLNKLQAQYAPPAVSVPDGPHTPPVRRRCLFSGVVQGVGFRWEAKMLAARLGLTGWVRNQSDGTVAAEVEGEAGRIDAFLQALQEVPRFEIAELQAEDLPCVGTETDFQVRY